MLKRKGLSVCSILCIFALLVGLFGFQTTAALAADSTWENKADVSWIDSSKKLVAFTFDDGPVGTYSTAPSQRILDVMEEYGMHCTFFYWGEKINSSNIAEIERAYSLGCEIGNHTFNHPYLTNMNQSQIQEQVQKTNDLLEPISGNDATLIRPPYGSVNNTVSSSVNAPMINWSRDSGDWNNGNYNSVLNQLRNVKDGDIVLMHENYEFTAQAVETVVPELIEKGFVIVSVSELMKMKGIEMQIGTKYDNQAVGKPNVYKPEPNVQVEEKIDAIGEVTLEKEAAIAEARAAYDALTDTQKAKVKNYDTLTAAEKLLEGLKETAALVLSVEEKIDAIGEVTLESETAIHAARAAYDALSADQKALVENVKVLTDAEADLKALQDAAAKEEADKAAAKAAEDKIADIGTVTLESEAAIQAARAAYDALTANQKALVENLKVLEDAEIALAKLKAEAAKKEADKAAAKAVEDKIAAIGEVTLESEAAIVEARAAYDALSEEQKALVAAASEATLVAAEAALETLKNFIPFTDVSGWYEDAVRYVYRYKLMNGVSDEKFDPNGTMTRAMLVTILYRLEGEPASDYEMNFSDVELGKWYTNAIRWAASEGIVEGYGNGKFGTTDPITREQMALILQRYAKGCGKDVSDRAVLDDFGDASKVGSWALDAMQWAVAKGLIQGTSDGNLSPQGSATRAQAATILMRFCNEYI